MSLFFADLHFNQTNILLYDPPARGLYGLLAALCICYPHTEIFVQLSFLLFLKTDYYRSYTSI